MHRSASSWQSVVRKHLSGKPHCDRARAAAPCRIEGLEGRQLLAVAGYNGADSGLSGLTHTLVSTDMSSLSGWINVNGNAPALVTSDPNVTHEPYMSLNNGLVRAELNQTLNQDFTVSLKMLHTADSRSQWVGLFDSAGRKGYAILWDSSTAGGNGALSIRKFDLASELLAWNTNGTQLGSAVDSGKADTVPPFGIIKFTWDNYTDTLTASMNGVQKISLTDSSFASFSRVYIKGNTSGLFDDLTVSTGNKLQGGTLIDDRFTDFASNTDPTTKADQTWRVLSGGGTIVDESGERRLKFTSANARLATRNASVLGTTSSEPLVNVSYDIRRSATSGVAGALFLVNDSGAGYGFFTELRADSFGDTILRVKNTTDWGATYTEVGTFRYFSGATGTGNHNVTFSWNRSSSTAFGIPANTIVAMMDGKTPQTIATTSTYTGFTQAVAWAGSANVLFMDNILVSSVPSTAVNLASYITSAFDTLDDQTGINNAIAATGAGGTLYAPPGTYYHSSTVSINGKKLIGAGQNTVFHATDPGYINGNGDWIYSGAIYLQGTSPAARRLRTTSVAAHRSPATSACGISVLLNTTNYTITDVQVGNAQGAGPGGAGIYAQKASYGNTVNNTVLNSLADGIHHTHGTNNVQVFNNNVRNPGDDQIAVVSYANQGYVACSNIQIFHNITKGQTGGRGLTVVGGNNVTIDNNEVKDAWGSGLLVAAESSYDTFGVDGVVVRRNKVTSPRGLNEDSLLTMPGIYVHGASGRIVTNVTVENNTLDNAAYRGIAIGSNANTISIRSNTVNNTANVGIWAGGGLAGTTINISNNTIYRTGYDGLYVENTATGTYFLDANHFTDINTTGSANVRVIHVYSSILDYVTITNNVYDETGAYDVQWFIRCSLTASKVNKGGTDNDGNNDPTTTGETCWWAA